MTITDALAAPVTVAAPALPPADSSCCLCVPSAALESTDLSAARAAVEDSVATFRIRRLDYEPDPFRDVVVAHVIRRAVPVPEPVALDPQAVVAAQYLMRAACEVLTGTRPAQQLRDCATASVIRYLRATTLRYPIGLTSLHVAQPTPAAAEITAVAAIGPRRHAIAARLDRRPRDHTWQCTAWRLLSGVSTDCGRRP